MVAAPLPSPPEIIPLLSLHTHTQVSLHTTIPAPFALTPSISRRSGGRGVGAIAVGAPSLSPREIMSLFSLHTHTHVTLSIFLPVLFAPTPNISRHYGGRGVTAVAVAPLPASDIVPLSFSPRHDSSPPAPLPLRPFFRSSLSHHIILHVFSAPAPLNISTPAERERQRACDRHLRDRRCCWGGALIAFSEIALPIAPISISPHLAVAHEQLKEVRRRVPRVRIDVRTLLLLIISPMEIVVVVVANRDSIAEIGLLR